MRCACFLSPKTPSNGATTPPTTKDASLLFRSKTRVRLQWIKGIDGSPQLVNVAISKATLGD